MLIKYSILIISSILINIKVGVSILKSFKLIINEPFATKPFAISIVAEVLIFLVIPWGSLAWYA